MPEDSTDSMSERRRSLKDFEGTWNVTRQIAHADGTRAHFAGEAVWMLEGEGMKYEETGTLWIGECAPIIATRRYFWTPDLAVLFDDGRFFHSVPPAGGRTSHWCPPDQYEGRYDFDLWPEFRVTWHVSGPRKSYRMDSRYSCPCP
jgi:hypothetical protein